MDKEFLINKNKELIFLKKNILQKRNGNRKQYFFLEKYSTKKENEKSILFSKKRKKNIFLNIYNLKNIYKIFYINFEELQNVIFTKFRIFMKIVKQFKRKQLSKNI